MSESASELNDDGAQFFADGARWDIVVVIAVAAVLAGGVFGWIGVVAVLAVSVGALLIAAATFAFVGLVIRSVAKNAQTELDGTDGGEDGD